MENSRDFVIEHVIGSENGTVLKKYNGPGGNVAIPEGVTEIGWYAFMNCTSLTSITIPEGVTEIDSGAFMNCTSLTGITIPEGVTKIGGSAFKGCRGLTSITIPASVTEIDTYVFEDCTGLTHIHVASGNQIYCSMDGLLLQRNQDNLILVRCPLRRTGAFTIPEGVTKIGRGAFDDCTGLTSIVIPYGITEIGLHAFRNCTGLTSIVIPEGLAEIDSYTFDGCTGLTSITIQKGITGIGEHAFRNCMSLTSVTIPEGVTGIGDGAFEGCTSLAGIVIPEGVTGIGRWAFDNCASLASITIPASVTDISGWPYNSVQGPFDGCTALTDIQVDAGNQDYCSMDGLLLLQNQNALVLIRCPQGRTGELAIPEGVTEIGRDAFKDCRHLTSVTIPASVTDINGWPFGGCTALADIQVDAGNQALRVNDGMLLERKDDSEDIILLGILPGRSGELTIPEGVTNILRDSLEEYCDYPIDITLPRSYVKSLARIREGAFAGCRRLTGIVIPEGMVHIEKKSFKGCTSLAHVDIPASVTYIGSYVFDGCKSLIDIRVDAENKVFSSFDGMLLKGNQDALILARCPQGRKGAFTVPEGVTEVGACAFEECVDLTSIVIPKSVTDIQTSFDDCECLSHIYVEAGNRCYCSMDGMLVRRDQDGLVLKRCPEKKGANWTSRRASLRLAMGLSEAART